MTPGLRGKATLEFADTIHRDISAATFAGQHLWLGSDETLRLERLTALGGGRFGEHRWLDLAACFDLPHEDADAGEIDIEGMATDHGHLWIAGSHSLARHKPKLRVHGPAEALDALAEVECHPNRFFLGRLPLAADGWVAPDGAACLKMRRKGGNALTKALRHDRHIGPHMALPAKENGFDVEGLAVSGERVFLGLRGPVLRGWAMLLELRVTADGNRLKLKPFDDSGLPYRKHFLDLDGCGVRDLVLLDGALLILAGATMDLPAPASVWRWGGALDAGQGLVVGRPALAKLFDLPFTPEGDKAEAIAPWRSEEGRVEALLVAHDSPTEARLGKDPPSLEVDLFPLP